MKFKNLRIGDKFKTSSFGATYVKIRPRWIMHHKYSVVKFLKNSKVVHFDYMPKSKGSLFYFPNNQNVIKVKS